MGKASGKSGKTKRKLGILGLAVQCSDEDSDYVPGMTGGRFYLIFKLGAIGLQVKLACIFKPWLIVHDADDEEGGARDTKRRVASRRHTHAATGDDDDVPLAARIHAKAAKVREEHAIQAHLVCNTRFVMIARSLLNKLVGKCSTVASGVNAEVSRSNHSCTLASSKVYCYYWWCCKWHLWRCLAT
jgi:hypothetical protein